MGFFFFFVTQNPMSNDHPSHAPSNKNRWHILQITKRTYLLVFVLQRDLVLAGSFPLGPLHFLYATGGCSILQAQHLSTATEIRTESSQTSSLTSKTLPLSQRQVISYVECEEVHEESSRWRVMCVAVALARGKDD